MSSVSWMAEKTSTELIPMLKGAYSALKDKEKDLVLAAELGKSLLEHNLQLKSKYDSLLSTVTPPITPSSSMVPIQEQQVCKNDLGDDLNDEESAMRFVPSRGTREAMIEVLERKNLELTSKLEQAMAEQDKQRRLNSKRTRQLENEINFLKSDLDIATTKIQELQEMNERQKQLEANTNFNIFKKVKEEEKLVDELYSEIDKIKHEKYSIIQSKKELETKLSATLKDLGELKTQFEKFEFTQQDFDRLKEAYDRQFIHIDELNHSLEEHRNILQKLKDRGASLYSALSVSASSSYSGYSNINEIRDQLRSTLLSELETEWFKSNKVNTLPYVNTEPKAANNKALSSISKSSQESSTMMRDFLEFKEKTLTAIYNAPSIGFESVLSKATGIDQDVLDDTISFIDRIERQHYKDKGVLFSCHYEDDNVEKYNISDLNDQYPSSDLYPFISSSENTVSNADEIESFAGRLRNYIRNLFNLIWKWCRFTMILTIALLINIWQGPDILFSRF
ncbi:MAG: hypothetical protein EXX96DRAFT_593403 [Benjaminiella poitrasii]|nr:MAG: hypothetical protein EXX96DRAFT_593403 [Benjaminiella poitrasii]